jgi:hypothetical protein
LRTITITLSDQQEHNIKLFVERMNKELLSRQRETMDQEAFESLTLGGTRPYLGAIGGGPIYSTMSTSLGSIVKVNYLGETIDVTEYHLW